MRSAPSPPKAFSITVVAPIVKVLPAKVLLLRELRSKLMLEVIAAALMVSIPELSCKVVLAASAVKLANSSV